LALAKAARRQLNRRPLGHPCAIISFAVGLISLLSRQALSPVQRDLACLFCRTASAPCSRASATPSYMPTAQNAVAPCSLADAMLSCMPIQSPRDRAMLTRMRNAIADAHPVGMPSRQAHSRAQGHCACRSRRNAITPCPVVCAT
jgi:hypothetical protein